MNKTIFQWFKMCFSYISDICSIVEIMLFLQFDPKEARKWISLQTRYSVIWLKLRYLNIKHHYSITLWFSRATVAQQCTVFWVNVRSSTLTRDRYSSLITKRWIQNTFREREMFVIICSYLLFMHVSWCYRCLGECKISRSLFVTVY